MFPKALGHRDGGAREVWGQPPGPQTSPVDRLAHRVSDHLPKPTGAEWGLEPGLLGGRPGPHSAFGISTFHPWRRLLPRRPLPSCLLRGANPARPPAPSPALWTFLWFVGFCFLTNQWAATKVEDVLVGADSARAAITFSFFSVFSWVRGPRRAGPCLCAGVAGGQEPKPWGSLQGLLASLAYQRYKAGVDDFIQNYVDPTPDPSTAYASYPGVPADNYQQPPFTQNAETSEGYQPPPVY